MTIALTNTCARLFMAAMALSALLCTAMWSAESAAQTLAGAQAQKSPQAEVVLKYEQALISNGVDAASAYMTPKKLNDMREMVKVVGEEFKAFQINMRATWQSEERRKQIEKLVVQGEHATLTARTSPNQVDEIPLLRTKEGWKIAVRGE